jgi:hypothetical protein
MSELSFNFSLTGAGKINFSLNFEPSSNPCENLTVSDPDPNTISDLTIARADSVLTMPGSDGAVGFPLFDNMSEIDDNDLNSALFGDDWRNVCENLSFDNEIVENPLPAPLIDDEVVFEGEGTIRDAGDVTSSTENKPDAF